MFLFFNFTHVGNFLLINVFIYLYIIIIILYMNKITQNFRTVKKKKFYIFSPPDGIYDQFVHFPIILILNYFL